MKKIDIAKSTVLGVSNDDTDGLKLGISGYFSHYSNFETYVEGELDGFTYSEFMTTQEDPNGEYSNQWYDYFIPEDKVVFIEEEKEKKLRPYKDISEFCNETGCEEVGSDIITIRNKSSKQECVLLYVGYSDDAVHLGGYVLTFETLLKHYEYALNSFEWLPFGVME